MASNLAYYSLSTLLGRQTLGEEYCDIMQVDGIRRIPASLLRRSSLVALTVVAPYVAELLSVYIERFLRPRVQTLSGKEPIKEETRKRWAVWFARFRNSLTVFQRVHIMLFYIFGLYYNFPKRLTNIQMVRLFFFNFTLMIAPMTYSNLPFPRFLLVNYRKERNVRRLPSLECCSGSNFRFRSFCGLRTHGRSARSPLSSKMKKLRNQMI